MGIASYDTKRPTPLADGRERAKTDDQAYVGATNMALIHRYKVRPTAYLLAGQNRTSVDVTVARRLLDYYESRRLALGLPWAVVDISIPVNQEWDRGCDELGDYDRREYRLTTYGEPEWEMIVFTTLTGDWRRES